MISLIIPVYNVSSYICDCIDSIKAQSMQDFEVLLVDDHGQDDSIAVAQAYVAGDSRFHFLSTTQNSGPGIARNVGIDSARGLYIAFIDGDDRLDPTFLEQLYEAATQAPSMQGCDLAYCQLQYQGGAHDGEVFRNPVVTTGIFTPSKKQHFLRHFVTFSVCFLFRRDFLLDNGLHFPANRNSEDTNFLTRCLLLAQSIACVDAPLYQYWIRQASLTTGQNRHRYKERLTALNALMRDYWSLCRDPRYSALHLTQYRFAMGLIWLKKGLAQSILEIIKNFR